jgi:hypothetical protein
MAETQRQPDGRRVRRLSKALTPKQLAELMAVKRMQLIGVQSPIMSLYARDPDIGPLIRRKLLDWLPPPEPWGRGWRLPQITALGERVMMDRCEAEMQHVLPKYEAEPE